MCLGKLSQNLKGNLIPHYKKEMVTCLEVLANAMVVIILPYMSIYVSSQRVAYLKRT